VIVPATRPIICLTELSRSEEPIWPRKYFWATMFVAFWDQLLGNSTFLCSNATRSPWPMRASRSSHSTVSNGWTPAVVKRRSIESASPVARSWEMVGCWGGFIGVFLSAAPAWWRSLEAVVGVDHAPARTGRKRYAGELP
jgi:hypothetical protein